MNGKVKYAEDPAYLNTYSSLITILTQSTPLFL